MVGLRLILEFAVISFLIADAFVTTASTRVQTIASMHNLHSSRTCFHVSIS
jgi:hypothetical protein